MHPPPLPQLLPPLGFHYTCKVMHKLLICYNFFCIVHFQISGIDHSNVMFHLGSGGGLLVTCFFLSFRHCELHAPCKQRFLSGMALSTCKVIPGVTPGNSWRGGGGGGLPPSSPNPDQVFQTKKCHFHTRLRPYVGRKCVMFT